MKYTTYILMIASLVVPSMVHSQSNYDNNELLEHIDRCTSSYREESQEMACLEREKDQCLEKLNEETCNNQLAEVELNLIHQYVEAFKEDNLYKKRVSQIQKRWLDYTKSECSLSNQLSAGDRYQDINEKDNIANANREILSACFEQLYRQRLIIIHDDAILYSR